MSYKTDHKEYLSPTGSTTTAIRQNTTDIDRSHSPFKQPLNDVINDTIHFNKSDSTINYLNETNYLKETNYLNETNSKQTLNVNLNKTLTDIDNNPISPILPSNGSLKLSTLSISSSAIETFPETLKFDN